MTDKLDIPTPGTPLPWGMFWDDIPHSEMRNTACKRTRAAYIAKAAEREREMVADAIDLLCPGLSSLPRIPLLKGPDMSVFGRGEFAIAAAEQAALPPERRAYLERDWL